MGNNDFLQQWQNESRDPAAPAGLQQQAAGRARQTQDGQGDFLQQWQNTPTGGPTGYTEQAQSWYTGANQDGTNNGWSSQFTADFIAGQNKAAADGTLNTYFQKPDATGVVTWDHKSDDGTQVYRFGDVYDHGKKQGNLYDQFDHATADLMMSDWIFPSKQKAEIFSDSDPTSRLRREVEDMRQQNNTNIPKALQAADFQKDVTKRAEEFDKEGVDNAITAGGVGGGVLLAGGAVAATGVGILPGLAIMGVGGLIGGVGAYLNKDSLTEQAARAYEITAMSSRENGDLAGLATGVQQWSGFGGQLISPLQNLNRGIVDWEQGTVGDGKAAYYKVNKKGENTRPGWSKYTDFGAMVGDSLVQFASPLGMTAYTAQMTGTITGEVGELALTGGKSFDYSRGGFDNVFTDDQGNFSPTQAAAGIGKVGIDVVQLGFARGLAGKADAALERGGEGAVYAGMRIGRSRLPQFLGGRTAEEQAAIAAGGREAEAAGMRFTLDAEGKVVSKRATLSILAPSEMLHSLSARVIAVRDVAKTKGAYNVDDFYRAANALATGERKINTVLVNAMGEGSEEAIQEVFDEHSHGQRLDFRSIEQAALGGFAAGAGMGLGTAYHAPSADAQMFYTAKLNDPSLDEAAWKAMPESEKRTRAAQSDTQRKLTEAAFAKYVDDQGFKATATVAQVNRLADAIQTNLDSAAGKISDRTDGAFVITQTQDAGRVDEDGNLTPDSIPNDGVATSLVQLSRNLNNHLRGMVIAHDKFTEDLKAVDPTDTEQVAELTRKIQLTEQVQLWGQQVTQYLEQVESRVSAATTYAEVAAESEALNHMLRLAFNRQVPEWNGRELTEDDKYSLARAVSHIFTRDPQDQAGSYQVLVPQMSPMLTWTGSDNVAQINHALLGAISGDYDGDKIRQLAQLVFDDNEYESARSGAYYLGAGSSVNIPAPKYEKYLIHYMAQALKGSDETMQAYAGGVLLDITEAIRRRYDGVVDDQVLDQVFGEFFTAVHRGSDKARGKLLDGLAQKAGGPITEFARGNLSNEWLWIDQLVRATMQEFQVAFVEYRNRETVPNTEGVAPHLRTPDDAEKRADDAATLGAQMGLLLPGDSLFRMFQKLHFSSLVTKALSAEQAGARMDLAEQAALYEALGQGITQSEIDAVRGKDNITNYVFVQLRRVAESSRKEMSKVLGRKVDFTEALAVVANLRVSELDVDSNGFYQAHQSGKKTVTLAQMLLKQATIADKRRNARVLDIDPDLQAKYAKLERMVKPQSRQNPNGAEQTFLEVMGDQTFYSILGPDSAVFGPHLTLNQYLRAYIGLDEAQRQDEWHKLNKELAYLGRKNTKDMPYDLDEVAKGKITSFRSVVDSIVAVGNGAISMDADGTLHGEIYDRSERTGQAMRDAHKNMLRLVDQMVEIGGRKKGETRIELVQRVLRTNPELDTAVANLIPKEYARYAVTRKGDQMVTANWVYALFDDKMTHEQAEMHLLRNIIMAGWRAAAVDPKAEDADEGQKSRQFHRLESRWHRVMWMAAAQRDGGIAYKNLLVQMQNAKSVKEFEHWVNTTPGIRGHQAPLVAWVDDTAEFDKDKTNGGWSQSLKGSELREAIKVLQTTTENLVEDMGREREAWEDDQRVLDAIEAGDADLISRMQTSIDQAAELADGVGPNAMVMQTAFAAWGFYGKAHNKGTNPLHVMPQGLYDAHRDAYGFLSNYERMMASLTSTNLSAIGQHLSQLPKDSGRTMTEDGRPVEWTKPTVEEMVALFRDPETRAYARAILYPQVLEATPSGQLSPQMVVGRSLRELLDGTSFNRLYDKWDKLSLDSAMRYGTMIEAMARKSEGHFSLQRLANDMTIAQLSGATEVLSFEDVVDMTHRNYFEIAQILQATSSIQAQDRNVRDGVLARLKAKYVKAQRASHLNQTMNLGDSLTDAAIDTFLTEREKDVIEEHDEILDRINDATPDAEVLRIQAQAQAVLDAHERYKARLDLLRADDPVQQVVEMFTIPDDPAEAAHHIAALQTYINVTGIDVFRNKATASTSTLRELASKMNDAQYDGVDKLTIEQWRELSRAATAIYLDELGSVTPSTISVPPFPDLGSEAGLRQSRYWDASFAYLLDDLFDADSPLLQAGVELHLRAGRQEIETVESELDSLMARTLFADHRFGQWTSDVARGSMYANAGLDSAAAAPAVAIAGDSPKRQATESAATARTFATSVGDVTLDQLTSKTTLSWLDLDTHDLNPFDMIEVSGAVNGPRPLAQMNNRFAKAVVLNFIDGQGQPQQLDLMAADKNVGWPFHARPETMGSGFQAIHLERIKQAIQNLAEINGFNPAAATVDVEFLHPDSQPSGPEWANNLFFEGTSFKLDADHHDSLNSTLWFSFGSISPQLQAQALQASKKGKAALQVVKMPTDQERRTIESKALLDFAGMLRDKAEIMVTKNLGFGRLDVEAFNSVYKNLKMRHFMRGTDADGKAVLWSAEQVIEFQLANPGADLPFENARLWVPTDQMLRDLLGEVGQQGVAARTSDPSLEITKVAPYRGVTPEMVKQVEAGLLNDGGITDTNIIHRARQSQMQVRGQLNTAARTAFETQMQYFSAIKQEVGIARTQLTQRDTGGFDWQKNLDTAVAAGNAMLQAENIALDLRTLIPFIGPRNAANLEAGQMLLANMAAIKKGTGYSTGWIYEEGVPSELPKGLLSNVSLNDSVPMAYRVAPGDLVVIRVNTFNGDMKKAKQRVDYFAGRGAYIVLAGERGDTNDQAELGAYLASRSYERVPGSKHLYEPENLDVRYQNVRARLQHMTEARVVAPRNHLMNLLVQGIDVEENSAYANSDNPNLQALGLQMDLVPTDWLYGFNVPVNDSSDQSQADKVMKQLQTFDNPEGRQFLRDMARPESMTDAKQIKDHDAQWDVAWDRMMKRFDEFNQVLPKEGTEFGTGDFIPLVGPNNRILLYRHGYMAPHDRAEVNKQANTPLPGSTDGANISIYPSVLNPAATTHRGKVVSIDPRSGYGLSMELNIDLQTLGGKVILEWNGMKYVLTPKPDRMILPDHSVFASGWGIDLISSLDDAIAKEAFGGMVNNHRNAFAYFGIDFLPDVAKFLGVEPAKAKDILDNVAKRADRISIATADELIAAGQIGPNIQRLLAPIAEESGAPGWVDKLATEQSVESQITTAMLIYLLTPGAQVKYVLQSGGFNDMTSNIDSFSRLMPPIFTQAFDRAPIGSKLRLEMNRRFNQQLHNPKHDGTGYSLSETWEFTVHNSGRIETPVSEVDAFDILSHYVPTDSNLTNEQIAQGHGDPDMWDRKLAEAKASGLYESIKNAGKITEPIVLADMTLKTPWPLPFVLDGHHRLVVAADLGIPVPWRYESDPEGARQTGAPRGVKKFNVVTTGTPGKDLVGMLQFSEAHFASENPVLNGQAFDESQRQSYSSHSAAIAHQATGGDVVYKYDIAQVRNFAKGVRELTTDDIANGTLWRELTNIDRDSAEAMADWRAESPAEAARRKVARASMIMFRQELVKTKEHGWEDEHKNSYRSISNDILRELGLDEKQGMLVDYWVRQQIGEALGKDNEGIERGNVSGDWAIEVAKEILDLVQKGYLPHVGAMVPRLHINDLQAIFRANYGKDNGWHPAEGVDPDTDRAGSWDDWVAVALGSGPLDSDVFDPLFLLATDGFMHTYQNATRSLLDLPVSLDREIQRQLMDPQTNMRLVSINPNIQTSTTQTLLVDFERAGLSDLLSGIRMTSNAPAGAVAKKKAQLLRWRKERNIPIPVKASERNFRRNGERFIDTSTKANSLSRNLINLRVGTAMINPALYFSMGPEQWIRGSLDRLANTLTLQSAAVRVNAKGEAVGAAARTAQILESLDETKLGEIMQRFGISYRYNREQLASLAILSESLGDSLDFKAMVYRDLMFLRPHAPDVGRIEKWLSNYAKFGARMQDPTWGMRAKTLGRRYVEAVLMHLEATPTLHNLTPELLVAEMQSDPTFLQKNFPDAHRAGTNAIAQLRSLKMTTGSKFLRGIYEPMAESDHAGINFFGNVVLKMPLLFSGYAMNVATTITGMQGADQMFAAFMHGRSKGFIGRMQARLRGQAFNPETDAVFDFSDVLEGADLTRAFIRGGLTHAGLFYFGMMAGGLGLTGEDDETKKRRRMSQLQGAGMIYDPRALENDFRNSDALFLDAIPFNLGSYFTVNGEGQEMAQMHWMMKQFMSPVLGMERFYETGDFRNVTWGFQDALGSFPLINTLMWSDAVSTANEFAKMASDNDKATLGGPEGMPRTAALLANGVGVYERMLFENSFVNQLYVGLDAYDRDPYVLPLRNSDGTIQRTIDNVPREQNISFQPYVDPETGEVKTGYVGRSDTSGTIHALTENRASMAFVSALFTGLGHSDYLRYNMPAKTREMPKPVMTQAEAEAVIHYLTQGEAQPQLTQDELVSVIKGQAMKGGSPNWDLYNSADALAKKAYDPNKLEPLSYFTADDREVLTHAGAAAIFRGILKGTAKPGDPSFAGIYIPMEMRQEIQAAWTKEIVQEGVDMGLDINKATSRMKRLWGGPYGDESVKGIGDILFDPAISYSPSTTYRQLNTTYVMGPDGKPWATGFTRDGLMGALGLKPLKRAYLSEQLDTTGTDERLNTTDFVNGTNTGLRALELIDDTINVPTDVEIGKAIEKAITDAAKQSYTPYTPYTKSGSSRYNGYGRRSYGGGGGYSSGGYPQFSKMYTLPGGTTAYANDIPFASVSNPILRRADIRRERVWSERGRLKQWQ